MDGGQKRDEELPGCAFPAGTWRRQLGGELAEFTLERGREGHTWAFDVKAADGESIYSSRDDPRATIDVFTSSQGWTAPRLRIDGRTVALHSPHLSTGIGFGGRPYKILVPAWALAWAGDAARGAAGGSDPGLAPELPVHLSPEDVRLTAANNGVARFALALDRLLRTDSTLRQAFRFVEISRRLALGALPRGATRRQARRRASIAQPLKILIAPGAPSARHSTRCRDYLESTGRGLVPFSTGGSCVIEVPVPGETNDTPGEFSPRLVRSLLHEIAHHVHHFVQPGGIPYSGRERRHSIRDIRNAAFAYREGEPQAFLQLLESCAPGGRPGDWRAGFGKALRRRRRWVRRLLRANQVYRSELASGLLLGALLTDGGLSRSVARPALYAPVASLYPSLAAIDPRRWTAADVAAAIPAHENAYIKYQAVKLLADPRTSKEYVQAFASMYPGDRARVLAVAAHVSGGLVLSRAAGRANLALLQAQLRCRLSPRDPRRWRDLQQALVRRGQAIEKAIARAFHAPVALTGDTRTPLVAAGHGGWVDLNAAGAGKLAAALGLDLPSARRIVRFRRRLRAGEFLALCDLWRPPPHALWPGRGARHLPSDLVEVLLDAVERAGTTARAAGAGGVWPWAIPVDAEDGRLDARDGSLAARDGKLAAGDRRLKAEA